MAKNLVTSLSELPTLQEKKALLFVSFTDTAAYKLSVVY